MKKCSFCGVERMLSKMLSPNSHERNMSNNIYIRKVRVSIIGLFGKPKIGYICNKCLKKIK